MSSKVNFSDLSVYRYAAPFRYASKAQDEPTLSSSSKEAKYEPAFQSVTDREESGHYTTTNSTPQTRPSSSSSPSEPIPSISIETWLFNAAKEGLWDIVEKYHEEYLDKMPFYMAHAFMDVAAEQNDKKAQEMFKIFKAKCQQQFGHGCTRCQDLEIRFHGMITLNRKC